MTFRVLFMLFFILSFVYADEKEVDKKTSIEYNLVRCLLTALENNPVCKKMSIDKKIAAIELKASASSFEWILSGTTSYNDSNDVSSQTVGITKSFLTGTSVGVSTSISDRSGALLDKSSSFSFNLTQELLAGATIKENDLPIFRSRIRHDQSANKLEDQIRSTLFRVSSNYFQYIKNEETVIINLNALKQSKKFLETVQELKKAGKGTNLDIATAEVQVASREEALLRSQTNILNALDLLKSSMGIDMVENITIFKDISLEVILPPLDFEKAYSHALNNRSDMMNSKLNLELQNQEVSVKNSSKKPNLKFLYGLSFSEAEDNFNGVYHYSDSPEHSLSLQFSMPLLRKKKIADYLTAKLSSEKFEIELWVLSQDIKLDIKRIIREIEAGIKTIAVQNQRMKTEEIRVQSFETRFENGLIDSLEVTRAYDDLDKARIDLINSKLNLKILVAEYHVAIGSQPTIVIENEKILMEKQTEKK